MIYLSRLSGSVFLLNADLIERVDTTPDTVITLVDGKKYVVAESLAGVLDAVVDYRASIVSLASLLDATEPPARPTAGPREDGPHLAAVRPVDGSGRRIRGGGS